MRAQALSDAAAWRVDTRRYGLAWEEEATAGSGGSIFFALLDEDGVRDPADDQTIAAPAASTR